ncbi:MAG: hypothetical protein HY298_07575 [Verrucomicrobia bacterium]|nr:hypothetical protein [Verrucomicrobiota bacterium]
MKKSLLTLLSLLAISQAAICQSQAAAPVVACPPAATVECGVPTTYSANVSDADGDALVAVWKLNGVAFQTNQVAAGSPHTAATITFTGSLPLGTNEIAITVTDTAGNSASCSSTIVVVDTTPPVIESVSTTPKRLWPPNHKLLPIIVKAVVTDACGPTTWKIISVTSNEAVNGHGDGNTSIDWVITGDHTVKLRSERSGQGSGRIYAITIQATDASGNVSEPATAIVSVPHDQRNKHR